MNTGNSLRVGLFLAIAFSLSASSVLAQAFKSYTPVVSGGTVIDFEGRAEGALIDTQYPGVTFGQAPMAGRPQIDNYSWLFGYGASSGSAVLTGSTEGGYTFPTVAGITATFDTPTSAVQAFLSDTAPIGDYDIQAFDSSNVLIDSITVLGGEILPPGYSGGAFPPPGTFPLPGIYVGFVHTSADIARIQIGPSSGFGDAFAVDDVQFLPIPEPGSLALLVGLGLGGSVLLGRRRA
jgi:hypothetical protein